MKRVYFTAAAVLTAASFAVADEIVLTDGSRIVGTVQQASYDKLHVKTEFAGDMAIDATRVRGLSTDERMSVQLKSGERYVGPLRFDAATGETFTGDGQRVAIDQVVAIWPAGAPSPDEQAAQLKAAAEKWKIRLHLGLNGETGNSENFSLNAGAQATRTTDHERLTLYTTTRYKRDTGETTTQEIIGGARLEVDITDRLYVFVTGELEHDRIENIDIRATVAAGLGYFVIRKPDQEFKIFGGPGFQHESYRDGSDSTNEAILVLGETYMHRFAPWLLFTHGITYYPTLSDIQDYRVVMENAGEIPISNDETWKLRLGIRHQYNAQPPEGVERLDTYYFLNLVYDWQ